MTPIHHLLTLWTTLSHELGDRDPLLLYMAGQVHACLLLAQSFEGGAASPQVWVMMRSVSAGAAAIAERDDELAEFIRDSAIGMPSTLVMLTSGDPKTKAVAEAILEDAEKAMENLLTRRGVIQTPRAEA